MELSKLKYPELEELSKEYKLKALLPTGSTEQHGPHLPIGSDAIISDEICKYVSKNRNDILLLPLISYGYSEHHMGFPGTITLKFETVEKVVKDIGYSLNRHNIKRFIVANGHGGNKEPAFKALSELKVEKKEMDISLFNLENQDFISRKAGYHANDYETSVMLYIRPELVDMSKACKEFPLKMTRTTYDIRRYLKSGVWGDPTTATAEKGKDYFDVMASALIEHIDSETPTWEQ